MIPWYITAALVMGALIAGHLWGLLAACQELDQTYEVGYDNGLVQGRQMERSIVNSSRDAFWGRR